MDSLVPRVLLDPIVDEEDEQRSAPPTVPRIIGLAKSAAAIFRRNPVAVAAAVATTNQGDAEPKLPSYPAVRPLEHKLEPRTEPPWARSNPEDVHEGWGVSSGGDMTLKEAMKKTAASEKPLHSRPIAPANKNDRRRVEQDKKKADLEDSVSYARAQATQQETRLGLEKKMINSNTSILKRYNRPVSTCQRHSIVDGGNMRTEKDYTQIVNVMNKWFKGVDDVSAYTAWEGFLQSYSKGCFNISKPPNPPTSLGTLSFLPAILPGNEPERLSAWDPYRDSWEIWSSPLAHRLKREVRGMFEIDMYSISFFNEDHEHLLQAFGLQQSEGEIDRASSLMAHVLYGTDVLVVLDTHKDWRFRKNPLVLKRPFIRFLVAAPIFDDNNYVIGVLGLYSTEARASFSPRSKRKLEDYCVGIMDEIASATRKYEGRPMFDRETPIFERESMVLGENGTGQAELQDSPEKESFQGLLPQFSRNQPGSTHPSRSLARLYIAETQYQSMAGVDTPPTSNEDCHAALFHDESASKAIQTHRRPSATGSANRGVQNTESLLDLQYDEYPYDIPTVQEATNLRAYAWSPEPQIAPQNGSGSDKPNTGEFVNSGDLYISTAQGGAQQLSEVSRYYSSSDMTSIQNCPRNTLDTSLLLDNSDASQQREHFPRSSSSGNALTSERVQTSTPSNLINPRFDKDQQSPQSSQTSPRIRCSPFQLSNPPTPQLLDAPVMTGRLISPTTQSPLRNATPGPPPSTLPPPPKSPPSLPPSKATMRSPSRRSTGSRRSTASSYRSGKPRGWDEAAAQVAHECAHLASTLGYELFYVAKVNSSIETNGPTASIIAASGIQSKIVLNAAEHVYALSQFYESYYQELAHNKNPEVRFGILHKLVDTSEDSARVSGIVMGAFSTASIPDDEHRGALEYVEINRVIGATGALRKLLDCPLFTPEYVPPVRRLSGDAALTAEELAYKLRVKKWGAEYGGSVEEVATSDTSSPASLKVNVGRVSPPRANSSIKRSSSASSRYPDTVPSEVIARGSALEWEGAVEEKGDDGDDKEVVDGGVAWQHPSMASPHKHRSPFQFK